MIALALISVSFVPGTTGMKNGFVKDPRYWQGDVFNARTEANSLTWKLKGTGETCGPIIPHLLNGYTEEMNKIDAAQFLYPDRRYYPLGCAIKPAIGSERGGENERWFVYDAQDRIIRYYKPTDIDLYQYETPKKIRSAVKKFEGKQKKKGVSLADRVPVFGKHVTTFKKKGFYYEYPTLKFNLKTEDSEKDSLKLIFACDTERALFANCLADAISPKDETNFDLMQVKGFHEPKAKMQGHPAKPTLGHGVGIKPPTPDGTNRTFGAIAPAVKSPAKGDSGASADGKTFVSIIKKAWETPQDLNKFRETEEFQHAEGLLQQAFQTLNERRGGVAGGC